MSYWASPALYPLHGTRRKEVNPPGSLNEGRGLSPGDTVSDRPGELRLDARSTKAGA